MHHVKPHGVLYGMIYRDKELCAAVYEAIPKGMLHCSRGRDLNLTFSGVPVFGLAGTIQEEVAKELGLPFIAELYGDVKYSADGKLVIDRKKKPWSPEDTKKHISSQLENSSVTAVTGEEVQLPIGDYEVSLCCHSDSPGAVTIVTAARQMIDEFNKKQGYA